MNYCGPIVSHFRMPKNYIKAFQICHLVPPPPLSKLRKSYAALPRYPRCTVVISCRWDTGDDGHRRFVAKLRKSTELVRSLRLL